MESDGNSQNEGKVFGYLEMKSRLNFWRRWRKYWFVLDGKMLLYYKSKEKYENLGRCKGFLNMSLAQAVQPCSESRSYPLEIITRTRNVQLSACDEENRQKWLTALINSLRLPEVSAPILERLSSRLSITAIPPSRKSQPTDSRLVMVDLQEENEPTTDNSSRSELTSNSADTLLIKDENGSVEGKDKEEWPELGHRRRSLYEEIVEEVLELTGKKLARDGGRECHSIVPPKPPRIGYKSGCLIDKKKNCGVDETDSAKDNDVIGDVNRESKELRIVEKVEIKLEIVKKNVGNEENNMGFTGNDVKCVENEDQNVGNDENIGNNEEIESKTVATDQNHVEVTSEVAEVKEEKNKVNVGEKLFLVKLDVECEPYESANESSYVTAESSEFEDDVLSMSSNDNLDLKQPGSLSNMLEDNDDVFEIDMIQQAKKNLIRVESVPVNRNVQVILNRKFSL